MPSNREPRSLGKPSPSDLHAGLRLLLAEVQPLVQVDDEQAPLFEQGYDSIHLMEFRERLETLLGVHLAPVFIFEHRSLAELATALCREFGDSCALLCDLTEAGENLAKDVIARPAVVAEKVSACEEDAFFPLSPAQMRYWWVAELDAVAPIHNLPLGLRIRGAFDLEAFEAALARLTARQEVLRVVMDTRDNVPVQRIVPVDDFSLPLTLVDLTGSSREAAEQQRRDQIQTGLQKRMDFRAGCWTMTLFVFSDIEVYLHLNQHHIISDAWTMGLMMRELFALYSEIVDDLPAELGALGAGYRERVNRQIAEQQGEDYQTSLDVWLQRLQGELPILQLPHDHERPQRTRHAGDILRWERSAADMARLRALAGGSDASLYMLVLAAWSAVLARFSAQSELMVGTMVSNRSLQQDKAMMGCFSNILPLRLAPRLDAAFEDWLAEVRTVVLEALSHQKVSFQDMVSRLLPGRDSNRAVLFSTFFIYQNTMGEFDHLLDEIGLSIEEEEEAELRGTSEFDLYLQVREGRERFRFNFEYSTELFERDTVQRFADGLNAFFDQLLAAPVTKLAAVDVLAADERTRLLTQWGDAAVPVDMAAFFPDKLEQSADLAGDSLALIDGHERYTFAALNQRANRVAARLIELGIGHEDTVTICTERSVHMVTAMLAVLKVGATYVALDPAYPLQRIQFILEDTGSPVVLRTRGVDQDKLNRAAGVVLCVEDLVADAVDALNPTRLLTPDSLAYIIYTSGSTGKPKGVGIGHGSLNNLIQWGADTFDAEDWRGVLASSSICYDNSVFEILVTLALRGTVILAPNALHFPDLPAADEIRFLVSGAPTAVYEQVKAGAIPANVRTVGLAGEPLSHDLVKRLYACAQVERVFNLYGLTEATVYSITGLIEADLDGNPSVGRPLPNTPIYILDPYMQPVPRGVTGELYVGGIGLAREFINRPELTRERFVPDPFSDDADARLYRTGDLARYRRDGRVDILGRIDHQVKIRGFRVELGEIESVLRRHPDVAECVCLARERTPGDQRLVCWLVPEQDRFDANQLRQYLRSQLPDHMVPGYFVRLESMPFTPNRKINRRALPDPEWGGTPNAAVAEVVADEGSPLIAAYIEQLWREHLGLQDFDRDANFFDLGGHSLLILRIRTQIERETGVRLSLTDFFVYTSCAALTDYLQREHRAGMETRLAQRAPVTPAVTAAPAAIAPAPAEKPVAAPTPAVTVPEPAPTPAALAVADEAMAVVGMACRVAGSDDLFSFWDAVAEGRDLTCDAPAARWRRGDLPASLQRGGWLGDISGFDQSLFKLSPHELRLMDPQQRMALELAWETMERAGYRPSALKGGAVGVFMGASFNDYFRYLAEQGAAVDAHAGSGNALCMLANRLSYTFDFHGPSLTLDTACSSGLTALHLACQSLARGECDQALVGGVSLLIQAENPLIWNEAGMLADDGRSKAFLDGADGFGCGEGAGMVMLKPLQAALRDGDPIWGVVRGTAVNHDGNQKVGLTAPNPAAQARAIAAAHRVAGTRPEQVSYMEAHGTGTPLGDPLEVRGLRAAFGDAEQPYCTLGTLKTNVGHTGPPAGILSLIKVCLAMWFKELPPSPQSAPLNPECDLAGSPFALNDQRRFWEAHRGLRLAGISSFGFGGANAHAVVAEAPALPPRVAEPTRYSHLFTFSAKSVQALQQLAERLADELGLGLSESLGDLCHTANQGRELFEVRAALVVSRLDQLADKLRIIALTPADKLAALAGSDIFVTDGKGGAASSARLMRRLDGLVPAQWGRLQQWCHDSISRELIQNQALNQGEPGDLNDDQWHQLLQVLGQIHVLGGEVVFDALTEGRVWRRQVLATYPFQRSPFWVAPRPAVAPEAPSARAAMPALATEPVVAARENTQLAGWLHRSVWRAQPAVSAPLQAAAATPLLIFSHQAPAAEALHALGATPHVLVTEGAAFEQCAANHYQLPFTSYGAYLELFDVLEEEGLVPHELWWLAAQPASDADLDARLDAAPRALFHLLKALAKSTFAGELRLHLVTQGAVAVPGMDNTAIEPSFTALSGLLAAAVAETSRLQARVIDSDTPWFAPALLAELAGPIDAPLIALRGGRRFLPDTEAVPADAFSRHNHLVAGATYLITGGGSGIGLEVADWLGRQYGAKVILIGRRPLAECDAATRLAASLASGQARYFAADVGDVQAMTDLVVALKGQGMTVHGVFHAAGVQHAGLIAKKSAAAFQRVLAPKVIGAEVLQQVLQPLQPTFGVLFSSLAARKGNPFHADYSCANAYLDGMAARDRFWQSIQWGGWSEIGMGLALRESDAEQGWVPDMAPMSNQLGLALLQACLTLDEAVVVAAKLGYAGETTAAQPAPPVAQTPPSVAARAGRRELDDYVRALVAEHLGFDAAELPAAQPFLELGMDSILATRMTQQLNDDLNLKLPRTLLFEHGNCAALAQALLQRGALPPNTAAAVVAAPPAPLPAAVSEPVALANATFDLLQDAVAAQTTGSQTQAASDPRVSQAEDAVAIVGLACQLPEAEDLDAFWQKLRDGHGMTGPIPASRVAEGFPDGAQAGFFSDLNHFDPAFFGILPREASEMEPQQRLLLEVFWQAMEQAAVAPAELKAKRCGVFVGAAETFRNIDANPGKHSLLGHANALLANRLSYLLDLDGPSLTVDTLCSSSLTALHLAKQSLRTGECEVALVGGVRLGVSAAYYRGAAGMGVFSPKGTLRAFDRDADGMVLGEGAVALVLKPLARALADGNPVWGLLRGSAVNHNGRGSGLAAPRAEGQAKVVRAALDDARVAAHQIEYVEAHGTGTELGDPIEVEGLTKAFAEDGPRQQPCLIGSVKTNLGHLEPAAGLVGLAKVLLALKHNLIPAHLHLAELNPTLDLQAGGFVVARDNTAWPRHAQPRRAGISSFGIGGANAHVIVEDAPPIQGGGDGSRRAYHSALLSAPDAQGLHALAQRWSAALAAQPGIEASAVEKTMLAGRRHFASRAAFVFRQPQQLVEQLAAFTPDQARHTGTHTPRVALLFSGQGAQFSGMGRELLQREPAFRAAFDECLALLPADLARELPNVMFDAEREADLDNTRYTQPALFVFEYACFRMWQARGLQFDAVIGHSIGEYVAAVAAGAVSLADGLRLVEARSRLMAALPAGGAMAAVRLAPARLQQELQQGVALEVAAFNGPDSFVLSGQAAAVDAFVAHLRALGIKAQRLPVSHAFHSALMTPMLAAFREVAATVQAQTPQCTLIANLYGDDLGARPLDADYWVNHLRQPVRFYPGLKALVDQGTAVFLEMGPKATLAGMGRRAFSDAPAVWLASSGEGDAASKCEAEALVELYQQGVTLDWRHIGTHLAGSMAELPAYPFQRMDLSLIKPRHLTAPAVLQDSEAAAPEVSLPTTPEAAAAPAAVAPVAPAANPVTPAVSPDAWKWRLAELVATLLQLDSETIPQELSLQELGFEQDELDLLLAEVGRQWPSQAMAGARLHHSIRDLANLAAETTTRVQAMPAVADHAPRPSAPTSTAQAQAAVLTPPAVAADQALDCVLAPLTQLFADELGLAADALPVEVSLVELGVDSMTLGSVLAVIADSFGVEIKMRQVFGSLDSVRAIAVFLLDHIQTEGLPMPSHERTAAGAPQATATPNAPAASNAPAAPAAAVTAVLTLVQSLFAEELGLDATALRVDVPLLELGVDSLVLSGVLHEIAQKFGVVLKARQVFGELETIHAIAAFLEREGGLPAGETPAASPVEAEVAVLAAPIVSGRFDHIELEPSTATRIVPGSFVPFVAKRKLDDAEEASQEAYLAGLADEYVQRTRRSKQLTQDHRAHLADNRNSTGFRFSIKEMLYPILAAESAGSKIVDIDGNEYVDISMGFGVHFFGHSPDFVVDALDHQFRNGYHLGPQSHVVGEAAELFHKLTGNERVAFCNTGTEAVMVALRLARTVTGRDKIVVFENSYHGFYDGTLASPKPTEQNPLASTAMAPGLVPGAADSVIVLPYNTHHALEVIDALGDQLAAVLLEPVQSRRADLRPGPFLHALRAVTEQHGTALIFDEVVSGFRCHPGGAQAYFGVRADLATYGKALGGGMPIGAIGGKARFLDAVDGGFWRFGDRSFPTVDQTFFASTFAKHPLTMAATLASLREFDRRGPALQAELNHKTQALVQRLNQFLEQVEAPIEMIGFGSLFRFAFYGNLDLLFYRLASKGVFVWEGRNFFLSTAHSDADIQFIENAIRETVTELQAHNIIPRGLPRGVR